MTASKSNTDVSNLNAHLFVSPQIVNHVTGDRMTILASGNDTDGEYLKVQFDLPPGAKGSPLHYHGSMYETFEVLQGSLNMELGQERTKKILQPGEKVEVHAGMYHSFWNESEYWVTFISEMRPAGNFEQFLRAWYGLANDGKANQDGVPNNLLQLAVVVQKSDTIVAGQPLLVQKILFNTLSTIARVFKVEQSLTKYWQ